MLDISIWFVNTCICNWKKKLNKYTVAVETKERSNEIMFIILPENCDTKCLYNNFLLFSLTIRMQTNSIVEFINY